MKNEKCFFLMAFSPLSLELYQPLLKVGPAGGLPACRHSQPRLLFRPCVSKIAAAIPSDSRTFYRHGRGSPRSRPRDFAIYIRDRKSTRLNSSHLGISNAVFCLKKKNKLI